MGRRGGGEGEGREEEGRREQGGGEGAALHRQSASLELSPGQARRPPALAPVQPHCQQLSPPTLSAHTPHLLPRASPILGPWFTCHSSRGAPVVPGASSPTTRHFLTPRAGEGLLPHCCGLQTSRPWGALSINPGPPMVVAVVPTPLVASVHAQEQAAVAEATIIPALTVSSSDRARPALRMRGLGTDGCRSYHHPHHPVRPTRGGGRNGPASPTCRWQRQQSDPDRLSPARPGTRDAAASVRGQPGLSAGSPASSLPLFLYPII